MGRYYVLDRETGAEAYLDDLKKASKLFKLMDKRAEELRRSMRSSPS